MEGNNIILSTDSYKVTHWKQYPPKTEKVYSYFESRGGQFDGTVFFGLQYLMDRYLTEGVWPAQVTEAAELYAKHFGSPDLFNKEGWDYIARRGFLPIEIKAVPEGIRVPTHNVLMTIENTDPKVPWLTNFIETLLVQTWYPTTVATLSWETRKLILKYLTETGNPELIDFKLHDFGFRGATTLEAAGIGGCAHLVNFLGTDTVPALGVARDYYGADMAGFSVPASEHSTMTAWGREHEVDAFRNMIEQYGDQPFYSVVSDSYDLFKAARSLWGGALKSQVLGAGGTLVVRPDSGVPSVIVPQLLQVLGEQFGFQVNYKGFRVLNPKVRIIQGDGMDINSIEQTLSSMMMQGWSADNVTFGMGGGLLQKVNRDTQKFAFKCSSAVVDGIERDVFKEPATDNGKVSKKGRLGLTAELKTVSEDDNELLETVFLNGEIIKRYTLDEIRENAGTVVPAVV